MQAVPEGSKVNVLLVDDRPDGILAMEAVLKGAEYRLVTATSGEEALRHFLRDDFAVVLLDVQMPGMDGFETAKRMRRAEGIKKTPIIFVTAINVEDKYVHTGYETGAVDYVFKPFDATILRSKVAVFAELYRMQAELQRQSDLMREIERKDRERLLAELELESLRRYQNLADAIPHIIWKARPDGTLDYFNKVWFDYTGLTLDQSSGSGWQGVVHADDLPGLRLTWANAAKGTTGFESEFRLRRAKDNAYRWHLIRAVPECDVLGEVRCWLISSTDIHDRKLADQERASLLVLEQAAHEEMRRAKETAEDASRAKSQLLANMSHEIRTPLGIVLGLTELLLETPATVEEREESLRAILRNGRQLSKLVDDILDISKIEAGRLDIEAVASTLSEVLDDVGATVGFQARQKGLQLLIDVDPAVPTRFRTDPTRLRQILTNVVGNAVKFTEKGTVRLRIDASPIADGHRRLTFAVDDTGVGIAPAAQERLFQDFMQADTTMTRRFGGTGLGLALSRRLARLLGGDVVLDRTETGKGSRFVLTIVVEVAGEGPVAGVACKVADPDLHGLSVLLVEDAPDNQFLVTRILRRAGARVDVATDGQEGVTLALAGDHDLVLMDLQMPNLDGYQATERLRAAGYRRPIIALTAHAMKEERERCLARGFSDHLSKPIRTNELMTRIQRHGRLRLAGQPRNGSPPDEPTVTQ